MKSLRVDGLVLELPGEVMSRQDHLVSRVLNWHLCLQSLFLLENLPVDWKCGMLVNKGDLNARVTRCDD